MVESLKKQFQLFSSSADAITKALPDLEQHIQTGHDEGSILPAGDLQTERSSSAAFERVKQYLSQATSAYSEIAKLLNPEVITPQNEKGFHALSHQIAWLHYEWILFSELFGQPESIRLLAGRTNLCFGVIQHDLLDSIMVGITKAFDEDARTLSLRRAIAQLKDPPASASKQERTRIIQRKQQLAARCAVLKTACASITAHRHERIVHTNADVAVDNKVLANPSMLELAQAIEGIAQLFNHVAQARTEGETSFGFHSAEMDMRPSAKMLLHIIRQGNAVIDEKWAEHQGILNRLSQGESVENAEEQLAELRKWFSGKAK